VHASNADEPVAVSRARIDELRAKGEAAAQRAIQSDPNLPAGHYGLAIFAWSRGKHLEAEGFLNKALALDPNDSNTLVGYGDWVGSVGRPKDALAAFEKARAIEPFQPAIVRRTAEYRWVNGQNEPAIALAKSSQSLNRAPTLAMIYASMGRYAEASDALMEIGSDPNSAAAQTARLLRTAPAKSGSPDKLPRLPVNLEFAYLHVGALDRAMASYERRVQVGFFVAAQGTQLWHPSYSAVRKTQAFKGYARNGGLVDYWRAKGWPDLCHPVGSDDFACN
jgi:tetratricopeptide (TPR) repeat protein